MGIELPRFLDTVLNNPSAQTSTDGVMAPRTVQTSASTYADTRSSYSQPQSRSAIVLPPSGILDAVTPGSRTLGIPGNYQPAVRSAVGNTISTVLATSASSSGSTDVGSDQYRGNVATRMFSGIRSVISSTAPTFGVSANAGPLSNGLAVLANSAVDIGKSQIVQKYGTTILNAQQYAVFGTAVLNSFNDQYDGLPEVAQNKAIKSIGQGNVPIKLPPLPIKLPTPGWANPAQQANQALQQGIQGSFVQSSTATINETEDTPRGTPNLYTYKVYLVSTLNAKDMFVFRTQPVIQMSDTAQYSEFSPLHAPGHILSYKNSPSRSFSISDFKLISRTAAEAQENLKYLHLLRSWTKPYFGRSQLEKTASDAFGGQTSSSYEIANEVAEPGVKYQTTASVTYAQQISDLERNRPGLLPDELPTQANLKKATDAMNQAITDNDMPAVMAASQRVKDISNRIKQQNGYSIRTGGGRGGQGGATAEQLYAARVGGGRGGQGGPMSYADRVGGGRGSQGGASLDELQRAGLAPITPTAETATAPEAGTVKNSIGSPPEVLYLYGYSEDGLSKSDTVQNIRRVPVVLTSVSFSYPNDVDYIPTLDGVPFPTVMTVTLELKETKAPYEIEQFSLADFKEGKLIGW